MNYTVCYKVVSAGGKRKHGALQGDCLWDGGTLTLCAFDYTAQAAPTAESHHPVLLCLLIGLLKT